jgi:transposase
MAMIQAKLSDDAKRELEEYRGQASSKNSEKALMVLMSGAGKSAVEISRILKRHPHTVRMWLKRYQQEGIQGLDRLYSPDRTKWLREEIKRYIEDILEKSTGDFGYHVGLWTVALMVHYLKTRKGLIVSEDTVERALKDMEFTYKRSALGISIHALSEEEKAREVKSIVNEIQTLTQQNDCEIVALDESYFSTEPYVIRGWQKKL